MADQEQFRYTPQLLNAYCMAALQNATELLAEASLLLEHKHYARAYFLGVASIEEAGKAFLAFESQNRNLTDPAVSVKLRDGFSDHSQKINSGFHAWIVAHPNLREVLPVAIDLIMQLKHGREPTMYADVDPQTSRIIVPASVTRPVAAEDCVRLATQCLAYTRDHVSSRQPATPTRTQDQLFSMRSTHFRAMLNTPDFWWFYIAEMEAGRGDLSVVAVKYRNEFVLKNRLFRLDADE